VALPTRNAAVAGPAASEWEPGRWHGDVR
jgi:hypothetical protein